MKIGFVVPGGVDPSGTHRVIPHLVERLSYLSERHDVHVYALRQPTRERHWTLAGAEVHNVGTAPRSARALTAVIREHRRRPFDVLHAVFLIPQALVAGLAGRILGVPVVAEAPGGEYVSLPEISWGGLFRWRDRVRVRWGSRLADEILVPSEAARLHAAAFGVCAKRLPWGADTDTWSPRPPSPRDMNKPVRLCWVASIR